VASKSRELSAYMADELDTSWRTNRGFEVLSVGIASVSYDDESKELINMRNKGAMLGDPNVREGYVQGSVARGMEAAGSSDGGAMGAFVGMGVGMGTGGGFVGAASETNRKMMEAERAAAAAPAASGGWDCACGKKGNTGNFCTECGAKKPEADTWTCSCGNVCTGKFCSNCGSKKPETSEWFCSDCGSKNSATARFCTNCGTRKA